MKILHVFSDEKFIDRHIKLYEGSDIHNVFAILKENHTYTGKYKNTIIHLFPDNAAYIKLCEEKLTYDAVIVYFLDSYKIRFIKDIKNPKTKILWSFYGAEIYSLPSLKYEFLSPDTQRLLDYIKLGINVDCIKQQLKKLIFKIQGKLSFHEELKKISGEIDYFLWYNEYEYDFLNTILDFKLPPFLKAVFSDNMDNFAPSQKLRNKTILLGNSRSAYNNHINVLKLLKKTAYNGDVIIPFGYGTASKYANRLKGVVEEYQFATTFLEEYVTLQEYVEIVASCTAIVLNSYRQMALGNILIAIRFGIKVYLNERNPLYNWLISMGFVISSVQKDLEFDLSNEKLSLEVSELNINERLYYKLMDQGHNKEFIEKIKDI